MLLDDCVIGNGQYYMGSMNITKTGRACQAWKDQSPHSHETPPDVFPQIKFGENHCRNAGGDEYTPWCFTMDLNTRWEHCNIPSCGKLAKALI